MKPAFSVGQVVNLNLHPAGIFQGVGSSQATPPPFQAPQSTSYPKGKLKRLKPRWPRKLRFQGLPGWDGLCSGAPEKAEGTTFHRSLSPPSASLLLVRQTSLSPSRVATTCRVAQLPHPAASEPFHTFAEKGHCLRLTPSPHPSPLENHSTVELGVYKLRTGSNCAEMQEGKGSHFLL